MFACSLFVFSYIWLLVVLFFFGGRIPHPSIVPHFYQYIPLSFPIKKKKKKTKLTTSNQSKNLIQTNLHRFFIANLDHHHPLSSSSIYISFASQFINSHTLKSLQSLQKMLTNFCKSNNMLIGYFRHNYYPKDVKRMTIAI